MNQLKLRFLSAATILWCTSAASAALLNSGFDTTPLADGGFTSAIPSWNVVIDGSSPFGVFNPTNTQFAGTTGDVGGAPANMPSPADGVQYLFIQGAVVVYQDVGALLPNTQYALTVALGRRLDLSGNSQIIELVNGSNNTGTVLSTGTFSQPTAGTFVDQQITYTTGAVVSGDLTIVLRILSATGQPAFDNVRLVTTPVPEPCAISLIGVAVLGMTRLARRRR